MNNVSDATAYFLQKQASKVRAYFRSLGAEIATECSPRGIEDDLHMIVGVCDAAFRETLEINRFEVLNDIVSMLALVTGEKSKSLILAFCEKLTKAPNNAVGLTCLKVLWSLHQSLDEASPMRYHVYFHLVQLAGKTEQIDFVYKNIERFKSQFAGNQPSTDEMQKLLRLLHEVLLTAKRSEEASDVMIMLLSTYTTENASQAREEAQRCITASLADPYTFRFDHLLTLKPVKFLEGELLHDLLKIFVSEKLDAYQKFYDSHHEFVSGLGLKHEDNLRKMKLLSFMKMAGTRTQITFAKVQQFMNLAEAEVADSELDVLSYVSQLLTAWKSNLDKSSVPSASVPSASVGPSDAPASVGLGAATASVGLGAATATTTHSPYASARVTAWRNAPSFVMPRTSTVSSNRSISVDEAGRINGRAGWRVPPAYIIFFFPHLGIEQEIAYSQLSFSEPQLATLCPIKTEDWSYFVLAEVDGEQTNVQVVGNTTHRIFPGQKVRVECVPLPLA